MQFVRSPTLSGNPAMVGEKIVIVEDEGIVALNLRSRLEAASYAIAGVADSAKTALAVVSSTMPDLILMDVRLKGSETGIEAAQQIRDRWNIPIVFLTGYSDMQILNAVQQTEPSGYLLKPIEPTELYSAIEIALRRHQTQSRLQQLVQERTEALAQINERLKTEIAERQRAEAEALQALEKERELSELKSRFITTASHEFRTPLSIVLTSAELLERLGPDCPVDRRARYFLKIRDAVRSMTTILTDMLTLGKADAGTLDFKPMLFDVQRFCISLLSDLQLGTDSRPSVQFNFVGNQPQVQLDPELLTLILNHLLSNAIKYSPHSGDVGLEVVSLTEEKTILFRVRDRGIGIPREDLPRVFESFHRAKNVDTIPGTGLGLTIVQQCVELHQGEVEIESELEQGTVVTVKLPKAG